MSEGKYGVWQSHDEKITSQAPSLHSLWGFKKEVHPASTSDTNTGVNSKTKASKTEVPTKMKDLLST